jgi:DeoR/GlpR family transcriptional regulator of sugar metabolism
MSAACAPRRRCPIAHGACAKLRGYVDQDDRHRLILETLERDGRVVVSELSAHTGVSEMTIRRDLGALEHVGELNRVHGGAVTARSRSYEPPFATRVRRRHDAKRRIGRAAADLLRDGDTAILDAGTTTLELARALRGRRRLRLLALSLHIADLLVDNPAITVMLPGGIARPGERSLIGAPAERTLADLSFDTFFMTVGGIDLEAGVTEYNLDDAAIKRAALASSRRHVAVADASKLATVAFAHICPLEQLDVLVTDADAPAPLLAEFRSAGVEVIAA